MKYDNIQIVLVGTQMPELIGMVSRVMLNFNFKNLILVNPKLKNWQTKATNPSCGALDVVNVEVYDNLLSAIASNNVVIAVSARKRYMNKASIELSEISKFLTNFNYNDNETDNKIKIAFLFGNEKNGLSNEDIAISNAILHINTNKDFSSLNLSQAVALVIYQLQSSLKDVKTVAMQGLDSCDNQNIASSGEISYLLQDLIERLEKKGYFASPNRRKVTLANIKNIYLKKGLSPSEVKTLIGIHKVLSK